MARSWPRLPAYDTQPSAEAVAPPGWSVFPIEALFDQLPIGKRFEQKATSERGLVPVIDQSSDSIIGWHSEEPGIQASEARPVVTFANHTCEMRVMRRPFSVIQNVFPLVGKPGVCSTEFLYYGTKGRVNLEEYKGHYPDFRRKWIPVPPPVEQRAIARILGSLDDKVELNRRMNETLEAMARALFKSWFVDFDPVRAKMRGEQPAGMDAATAALFPSTLVQTEHSEVPEGWTFGRLRTLACLNPESWSRATMPAEIRYVDLSSTKWGLIEGCARYLREDVPSRAQRILRPGDTIVGTVRPGNGSYSLIAEEGLTGSTGFAALRPMAGWARSFVYLAATAPANIERLAHLADGGAYPAVRPELVAETECPLARQKVLAAFERIAGGWLDHIAANRREDTVLVTLRDALLPRLLSGELRVGDVERSAEAPLTKPRAVSR